MSEEFEELEHIPWAALAARTPDPRWRIALVVASGCALVVLLLVAGKVMLAGGGDDGLPVEIPAAPSQQLAAAPPSPTSPDRSAAPVPGAVSPAEPVVYSEADLMAIATDDEQRLASMWARWFVRDFLTVDGDGATTSEVAGILPVDLPSVETTTFVEWVDVFAVSTIAPAVYRVEVGYRLLVEANGSFARRAPAALAVQLGIDGDGSVRLLHLPEIVPLPEGRAISGSGLAQDLPADVAKAVDLRAPGASIVGGHMEGSDWHVVVVGEIVPGLERPHVVVITTE